MADATKAAKERALAYDLDLDEIKGTGKDGRVTAADVDAYEEGHCPPDDADPENDSDDADDNSAEPTAVDPDDVDVPTAEDQAEGAEAALEGAGIDPDDLYAKEAALPQNAQPSGGVLPTVPEQIGPPITADQAKQLADQQAATEAVAEASGWTGEKVEPEEQTAPEDADNPEPEPQLEPNPVEALAERKAQNRADGEGPLPGSAEERQRDGATEESQRQPLLQRPAQEQTGHATAQNSAYQEGDTLPGDRSLENDEPAYQVAVNHVPGTPLPEEYYETAGPAPQPTSNPKRTPEELEELLGDVSADSEEDDD